MMNAKTFRLFIILLISSGSLFASTKIPENVDQGKKELGLYLSADVFGYIYPIFVKDAYYSSEVSATININNRFLPTVEAGIGYADMTSQLYDIGYKTRAPYYRVGMDYNMQYESNNPGYIYLGARIGYTSFKYNVDAPPLIDPIWGSEVPMLLTDMPFHAVWAEAVCGIRAEIAKNFHMGWSLRYKYLIYQGPISNGGPWYIPGFGVGKKGVLGATYTISYYFNLTRKQR